MENLAIVGELIAIVLVLAGICSELRGIKKALEKR